MKVLQENSYLWWHGIIFYLSKENVFFLELKVTYIALLSPIFLRKIGVKTVGKLNWQREAGPNSLTELLWLRLSLCQQFLGVGYKKKSQDNGLTLLYMWMHCNSMATILLCFIPLCACCYSLLPVPKHNHYNHKDVAGNLRWLDIYKPQKWKYRVAPFHRIIA